MHFLRLFLAVSLCAAGSAAGAEPMQSAAGRALANATITAQRGSLVNRNEAERRLGKARLAREQGRSPLAGEYARDIVPAAGNYRYWRRQEKLRQSVEQAQRRYNDTKQPPRVFRVASHP